MQYNIILYFILGFIILMLVTRRLIYGTFLMIILMPLERVWVTREFGLNIKLAEWMGLVCVIFFLWNFAIKPRKHMFIRQLLLPLFIFALVNFILLLVNLPNFLERGTLEDWNSPGFRSIKVVVWCIFSMLVAMAIAYSINDKNDLKKTIAVFLWVPLAISILSLLSMFLYLVGIKFLTWTLIGREGFTGVKGTFTEPAYLSNYLSSILPVALLVFILRVYRLGLLFTVIACFALLLASYFSFSTTGLAGMTLMLFLIPFLIQHYRLATTSKALRYSMTIIIGTYIVFLVGALFNVDFVKVTILNYFEKVIMPESRWAARVMGFNMFRDHPFVGFGPGNWAWCAEHQGYAQEVIKAKFIKPSWNCLYWEILVDLGLIGFIPFAWFFVNCFRQLSKSIWRTEDIFLRALSVGFIVGLIALLGEYYVAFNFYRIHVWVIFGIIMATIRLAKEDKKTA